MAPDEHQTMVRRRKHERAIVIAELQVEHVAYTPALNNHVVALVDALPSLSSALIRHHVVGFVLIKAVNTETKMVEVLLPAEAPIMSRLGLLNDAIFMDDVVERI